jgi:hypothetical protein
MINYIPIVIPITRHAAHPCGSPVSAFILLFGISVVLTLIDIFLKRHTFVISHYDYNPKSGKVEPIRVKVPFIIGGYIARLIAMFIPIVNVALPLANIFIFFCELKYSMYSKTTDLKFINWLVK